VLNRIRDVQRSLERAVQRQRAAMTRDPEVREIEERIGAAQAELAALDARKAELLEQRRALQRVLGERVGRDSQPLNKVEKTNGVPSFVHGVRLFQRIHRLADDPAAGHDGAGAVFASSERTERFVHSHGVPLSTGPDLGPEDRVVIAHAFHGNVGLVEVATAGAARHVDGDGADLGEVRPAVPHDGSIGLPASLAELSTWAATLSDHISRPYVQVVWRQDGDRLVLDRIDVDPDRIPVLTEEEDVRLGRLFDTGHARMLKQPYLAGALDNRVPGGTFDPDEPDEPSGAVTPT
jgi:uncharacterized small protein (DUF1192 family)